MKNCQEITEDIERSSLTRVSLKDRMAIKLHITICPDCKSYYKDSRAIDKLLKRIKLRTKYSFNENEKQVLKEKLSH